MLFSLDNRLINPHAFLASQDRVLGLHGVSTVSGTGVVSSPSANVTSAGLVSCAPRLSHTPPHDFREVLSSPMQPQTHQYYAPQYNPLHYQQQQQPRFDFTHPLEPFQTAHSQQFGNGPAGFHAASAGAPHQSMAGPTHPQPVSQHQARHPARMDTIQQVHMNQFAAGAAMEHARRMEERYSAVRRPDMLIADMMGPGNLQDSQVTEHFAFILLVTHCPLLFLILWRQKIQPLHQVRSRFLAAISTPWVEWRNAITTCDGKNHASLSHRKLKSNVLLETGNCYVCVGDEVVFERPSNILFIRKHLWSVDFRCWLIISI